MRNFIPRTSPPTIGEHPYIKSDNSDQCTYFCYYRATEVGFTKPCHHYSGKPGFGNAKDWPELINLDWENHYTKNDPNYRPVPGDIIVFDGNYGHVAFIEIDLGNDYYQISQFNKDSDGGYSSDRWHLGDIIVGRKYPTGKVKSYMHYKNN